MPLYIPHSQQWSEQYKGHCNFVLASEHDDVTIVYKDASEIEYDAKRDKIWAMKKWCYNVIIIENHYKRLWATGMPKTYESPLSYAIHDISSPWNNESPYLECRFTKCDVTEK